MSEQSDNIFALRMPRSILFGTGATARCGEEARALACRRALIVSDQGVANAGHTQELSDTLKASGLSTSLHIRQPREPSTEEVEECLGATKQRHVDLIVGLGGGSCLDVAKMVAVMVTNKGMVTDYCGTDLISKPGLPTLLLPTTAGTGSEVTPNAILILPQKQQKKAVVSQHLFATVAIVDPRLTYSMPSQVTAASGMDALVHAIEAYVSTHASAITDLLCIEAVRLVSKHLRQVFNQPDNRKSRERMALGSLYAGIAIANAGTGSVHALAYPLGGRFAIPHGVANALLLPYVTEVNYQASLSKFSKLADVIIGQSAPSSADNLVRALLELNQVLQLPVHLRELGIPREALDELAEAAAAQTRLLANNPKTLTLDEIRKIYSEAW